MSKPGLAATAEYPAHSARQGGQTVESCHSFLLPAEVEVVQGTALAEEL